MYISADVADRIKETAKQRHIPIKQLLNDVGMGFNTMSNMKNSMPKADNLAKIADYLGCSVDYLLGRTDTPNADPSLKAHSDESQGLSSESMFNLVKQRENAQKEKPSEYEGLSENHVKLLEYAKTVPEDKAALLLKVMKSIVEDGE